MIAPGQEIEKKTSESVELNNNIINPDKFELGKKPKRKKSKAKYTHSTHTGQALSVREENFITEYINNGGDKYDAYAKSGGNAKDSKSAATRLLNRPYIQEEISYRLSLIASKGVADANEVMQYFTAVMRGEVNDQFDMPASLPDRTNAAKELAKRLIDSEEKLKGNKNVDLTVVLDWERPEPSNIEKAEQMIEQEIEKK